MGLRAAELRRSGARSLFFSFCMGPGQDLLERMKAPPPQTPQSSLGVCVL